MSYGGREKERVIEGDADFLKKKITNPNWSRINDTLNVLEEKHVRTY
jgi:hypothetical protein